MNGRRKKAMKRGMAAVTLLPFILFFLAMLSPTFAEEGKLVFAWDDPIHDDHGPGYYSAPRMGIYAEYPGAFDIRRFEVRDLGNVVEFYVRFRGQLPRRDPELGTMPNGWLLTMVDVYIDKDHTWGKGYVKALHGRDVEFMPESAWEKCVLAIPERRTKVEAAIRDKTEALYMIEMLPDIVFPFSHRVSLNELSFRVTKKDLGGSPQESWGYQVLVTAFTLEPGRLTFYNKKVYSPRSDIEFGGGSNFYGNPNVIDMLAPGPKKQEEFLSRYVAHPNLAMVEYAKIPCVYTPEEMERYEYRMSMLPGGRSRKKVRENVVASLLESPVSSEDVQIREIKEVETGTVVEIPLGKSEPDTEKSITEEFEKARLAELKNTESSRPSRLENMAVAGKTERKNSSRRDLMDNVTEPPVTRPEISAGLESFTASQEGPGLMTEVEKKKEVRRRRSTILEPKTREKMELLIDEYKGKDIAKEEYMKEMQRRAQEKEKRKEKTSLAGLFARKKTEPKITVEDALADSLIKSDGDGEKAESGKAGRLPSELEPARQKKKDGRKKTSETSSDSSDDRSGELTSREIAIIETGKDIKPAVRKNSGGKAGEDGGEKSITIEDMLRGGGESGTKALCHQNMKVILEAAKKYQAEFPDDKNIALIDLVREKLLITQIRCPDGGHYDIRGENEDALYVKCVGTKHGTVR